MAIPSDMNPKFAGELMDLHGVTITNRLLARYRGIDPAIVADAMIDAVTRASREPDFPSPEHPDCAHRLARMARDRLRSTLRAESRRRHREQNYQKDVTRERSGGPEPLERLEAEELAEELRRQIARTGLEVAVLDLLLSGVTNPAEIAARLNVSLRTSKVHVDRLRQRISRERRRREENP